MLEKKIYKKNTSERDKSKPYIVFDKNVFSKCLPKKGELELT